MAQEAFKIAWAPDATRIEVAFVQIHLLGAFLAWQRKLLMMRRAILTLLGTTPLLLGVLIPELPRSSIGGTQHWQ